MAKTSKKASAERLRDAKLKAASTHCATVRERIVKLRKAQDLTGEEVTGMMENQPSRRLTCEARRPSTVKQRCQGE